MDRLRKVVKPARGQLNSEIKCPCRCIRGRYIWTVVCICLDTRYIFHLGTCTLFVHGSLLYMHTCVTTAVSVHIMHYEYSSTYIYIHTMCHDISSTFIMIRQFDQRVPAHNVKGKTWKYNETRP